MAFEIIQVSKVGAVVRSEPIANYMVATSRFENAKKSGLCAAVQLLDLRTALVKLKWRARGISESWIAGVLHNTA